VTAREAPGPGILVVAAQRELRRALFDALDGEGHAAIHAARDPAHAAALLGDGAALGLVVVVFDGDGRAAQAWCEQLRRLPSCTGAPLIAVLAEGAALRPAQLPAGVGDWLYAAQIERELLPRWQRLRRRAMPSDVPAAGSGAGEADYRFVFEEDDGEWLIVDPASERILEASPALVRHSGLQGDSVLDRPLADLLTLEDAGAERLMRAGDRRWHACGRRSAQGFDSGEVSARRVRHAGRAAVALVFRSDRAGARPAVALTLLARLFAKGGDDMAGAVRLLVDDLGLDYLAIWSARPEAGGAPVRLAQHWRGGEPAWPAARLQSSLRLVLDGRSLLHMADAQRLAGTDPLVAGLALRGFAGLPLLDERRNVLGALLAGSRQPFAEPEIVEPVLRCAAAHFAHALELGRTREQGRAEGLLDALTGLPNRLLFNDRLDTLIREVSRTGESFAVLFVDLDRFKSINDNLGHATGDQVLTAVTRRLCDSVRASDTVARYAGDEFVLVLRHIARRDDAAQVADKIVQSMEQPLRLDGGTELQATVSIGVSFFPGDASDAATLLRHADEAMYAAKRQGRNNYQVYDVSPERARQHASLKASLRHAQGNGELRVFYQPQVDAASEDIVGMEALVRWEHPELGFVGPGLFIPLAEETGLIVSIGEWVLRTACRQAQAWESRYGLRLRLGVNLSVAQLTRPDLTGTVAAVLRETGLDPALLELEVTESISIKAVPNLVENMNGLRGLGCRIAIDDFGTGAASLDYLRRLPADRIKIDQSFVRNIGVDPDDEAIVRATIDMAHRLKREVVAEGVEIEPHLLFLRQCGCDELQGYLFCRPLPQPGFERLLAERERLLAGATAAG